MTEKDFVRTDFDKTIDGGHVKWQSPSNIALVKYWGKHKNQIPANPSISFTLSHSKTITQVSFKKKEGKDFDFDIIFEGESNESFRPKIQTFFERIESYLPFLRDYHFKIETSNTFPHSSGIASSASGMSALALCLMSIEKQLTENSASGQLAQSSASYFNRKSSFLSRLGSGSACRSIEGPVVIWGKNKTFTNSSDSYGTKYEESIHSNFHNYQDAILLVDKGEKQVSSTVGHQLMNNHPFAQQRFSQAHDNLKFLKEVLISGDLKRFVEIVESEALTLHAMMMTSHPYFILMKPNTLEIINRIWAYRASSNSNLGFTLDAGANVHLLFPEAESEQVYEFIKSQLVAFCQNGQYICDNIGNGASQIE